MNRPFSKWNYRELLNLIEKLEKKCKDKNKIKCIKMLNYNIVTITSPMNIEKLINIVEKELHTEHQLDIVDKHTVIITYESYTKPRADVEYEITFNIDSESKEVKIIIKVESASQKDTLLELIEGLLKKTVTVKSVIYKVRR